MTDHLSASVIRALAIAWASLALATAGIGVATYAVFTMPQTPQHRRLPSPAALAERATALARTLAGALARGNDKTFCAHVSDDAAMQQMQGDCPAFVRQATGAEIQLLGHPVIRGKQVLVPILVNGFTTGSMLFYVRSDNTLVLERFQ